MTIRKLPEELISRIAAGEVVERPASVLKELIENSLDAGADELFVTIEGAGRTRLEVSDNGCGMIREQALLALERHATSKISRLEDLETLTTFGFRGEALPSLAAVSRFRLTTRSAEAESGWEFLLEGGKLRHEKPVAREPGTTIEVRDIFFNTPARFKFLKSDATERGQCLRVVEEMVFSSPGATFHLQTEKARPVVFQGGASLASRVAESWGSRWANGIRTLEAKSEHFALHGIVTNQAHHQATPRFQYLYVNRRPVQNRRITRAVYDGYQGQLPSLRHPGWVLFLEVDPRTVDVNVHPTKKEVKLSHESEIFGFVVASVRQALGSTAEIPTQLFAPVRSERRLAEKHAEQYAGERPMDFSFKSAFGAGAEGRTGAEEGVKSPVSSTPLQGDGVKSAVSGNRVLDTGDLTPSVVAQVRKTFIIAQSSEGLVLADQHAAAERVMYEKLLRNLKALTPQIQMLLVPFTWETSLSVQVLVKENLPVIRSMGFLIEPFGGNAFVVKGYPVHLGEKLDLHSLLDAMSDALSEPGESPVEHRLAAMAACKTSVKAGDPLDVKAGQKILDELMTCEAPLTCPHGRPTLIRLPYRELEHRFRR